MSDIVETPVVTPGSPQALVTKEEYQTPHDRMTPGEVFKEKKAAKSGANKGGNPNTPATKGVSAAPAAKAPDTGAPGVGNSAAVAGVPEGTEPSEVAPDGAVAEVAGEPGAAETATEKPEGAKDPKAEARERRLQKVLDETLEERRALHQATQRHKQEVETFKQRVAQVETQLQPYIAQVQEYLKLRELAKVNPKALIDHFQLDMRQAIQQDLNDGKPTPEQEIAYLKQKMAEREKFEQEREAERLRAFEQEKAEYERQQNAQVIAAQQQRVVSEIEAAKEQFPLLTKTKRFGAVWQTMVKHMEETNRLLPPLQAARYVEEALRERISQDATSLLPELEALGIVKKHAEEVPAAANTLPATAKPGPTLTNKSAAPSTTKVGRQPLPPKEVALEQAVALLKSRKK